jgi:nitrite reductase/ring-hydroxylating ferredoxin subunit/Fe-S cluster biogenesis protein NfuA
VGAAADEIERLAGRADRAVEAAQRLDEPARGVALELKQALDEIHKAGLVRVVRRLKDDPAGKQLLFELVDDPIVYALLAMHGIVRPDLATRVGRVIDAVRPYMRSHGGDVELVEVRDATAFIRLHGACNGCSMVSATLREGVEDALRANVPEIRAIEVVPSEPGPALIMPESIGVAASSATWIGGPKLDDIPPGRMRAFDADGVSVLVVNIGGQLRAYRNACAHQGMPLDRGTLDPDSGELTCPWHGWCFDVTSGECLVAPQAQLEPFPLRVAEGRVWVRR